MVNKFLRLWRKKLRWNFETNSKTSVSAFLPSALAEQSLNNDIACWLLALKRPRKKISLYGKSRAFFQERCCQNNASLMVQTVKNLPAIKENWLSSLGWDDPLEKGMATHSSIPAWRIPQKRGYSPWGSKELDTTEQLTLSIHFPDPILLYYLHLFFGWLSPSSWSVASCRTVRSMTIIPENKLSENCKETVSFANPRRFPFH